MNTNYTQKEGDKSYVKLKNQINDIPTEKIAEKLGLDIKKNGNSYQGECPTGHPSDGGKCFSIKVDEKYWKCFHCGQAYVYYIPTDDPIIDRMLD